MTLWRTELPHFSVSFFFSPCKGPKRRNPYAMADVLYTTTAGLFIHDKTPHDCARCRKIEESLGEETIQNLMKAAQKMTMPCLFPQCPTFCLECFFTIFMQMAEKKENRKKKMKMTWRKKMREKKKKEE